jgi:hypothetical protein
MARPAIKKFTTLLIIFSCGGLFFVNLGGLTPVGDAYQPRWVDAILSVVLAVWQSRHVNPCYELPAPEVAYAAYQARAKQPRAQSLPTAEARSGGLVERVVISTLPGAIDGELNTIAHAAIREVAAWLRTGRLLHAAELLEREIEQ